MIVGISGRLRKMECRLVPRKIECRYLNEPVPLWLLRFRSCEKLVFILLLYPLKSRFLRDIDPKRSLDCER